MAICRLRSLLSLSKCNSLFVSSPSQPFPIRSFSSSQVPPHLQNVGFIGLGNMGSRMANNLIKAGYRLTVHDLNSDVLKKFSQMGVPTKKTPYEVSEASDVVITMLPSSAHVIDVYTGPNGLLHGGKLLRPRLLIDSSTIDPLTSRNLSATISNYILKEKKGDWETPVKLDAPVSGSVIAAEAGTLTFMVGGSEEAFLAAKPLFFSMGKSAIYCGGAGSGSAAKICNNLAMAVSMLGVSEALALGQSLGVAASTLTKIFNCSSARCWSSDAYNPVPGVMEGVPSSRDYNGGFASKLMVKDLNLAVESAKQAGCKYPLAPSSSSSPGEIERDLELELELEQQVMKFQCLYGPSRVLFTIKEEEREGLESENGSSAECSAVVVKKTATKMAWLSEEVAVDEVAVAVDELLNEATPFSTPCASPPYYTPYSSPIRVAFKDNNGGNG